jgi:hypothetical protein
MVETARRLAGHEGCTIEEWFHSVILRQQRRNQPEDLFAYGEERTGASGYKEEDVVPLKWSHPAKFFPSVEIPKTTLYSPLPRRLVPASRCLGTLSFLS